MSYLAPVEQNTLTREYLKSAHILIVDQNSSARVGLKKLLVSTGAKLHQIYLASMFEEAEDMIRTYKPGLVFCDYQIEGKFGLDLLQKQRQEHPKETQQCIFILVTGNTSQSAVAQAAEEDIDAYILKPYTIESFMISLNQAIQIKVRPSDYLKLIQAGKELLEKNQFDDAMSTFRAAITKDSKPSLACFYEGLTHFKKTSLDGCEASYKKGIGFNKIHYKCLVGLFDLLMSSKKYEAAYEIVQKIVRFFPANPKRLSTVLKLAIQTKNYSDIDAFYQSFLKIDARNDELIKCVCAALIVCGKHFFEIQDQKMGVDLVQKASVTAARRPTILKKAIETLVQYDQVSEAKQILKRFSIPSEEDPHYAVGSLLISSKELKADIVASRGQELLKKGINDLVVYRITIESFEKLGKRDRAQELQDEAVKLYPELGYETRKAA